MLGNALKIRKGRLVIFLPLLIAAAAQAPSALDEGHTRLDQAYAAIQAGRPTEALSLASAVADKFESTVHRSSKHCVFSTDSLGQAVIYSTLTTKIRPWMMVTQSPKEAR